MQDHTLAEVVLLSVWVRIYLFQYSVLNNIFNVFVVVLSSPLANYIVRLRVIKTSSCISKVKNNPSHTHALPHAQSTTLKAPHQFPPHTHINSTQAHIH